ncbi:MAG: UV DNA damage repair endonuclease UvsE, partial [candidate division WOR-3 bacterium]
RLIETIGNNLDCLFTILRFNIEHNLYFFRITSDIVPFGSHPINTFEWQNFFNKRFRALGEFINFHKIRVSMHPDQFTLINSVDNEVFQRSVKELRYHADVLDLLGVPGSAKIQIHVGGVYGDKKKSIQRFIQRYEKIDTSIKERLVIENDDKQYTLQDCYTIHKETGIPIVFDFFHHELNNSGEKLCKAFEIFTKTWDRKDGIPMVDYSHQKRGRLPGTHTETINLSRFKTFLDATKPFDFDIMLEIKDKEKSALMAVEIASQDNRFKKIHAHASN